MTFPRQSFIRRNTSKLAKTECSYAAKFATITLVTMIAAIRTVSAANIGFVVDPGGDVDNLFDTFWLERLEDQGHSVEGIGADETAEDFEDIDIFIISNDVASGDVVATFGLDVEKRPIITYEWGLYDDIGFSDDGSGDRPEDTMFEITDPDHPLAAGLSGEVEIYSDFQGITRVIGETAPGLDVIATYDDLPSIAVLEPGAETFFGDPAPGLRIATFAHDGGDGELYTDEGLALLDASIAYALGETAADPGDFDSDGDLDVEDVNGLIWEIVKGTNDRAFDLNNDGSVKPDDLQMWVKTLKSTWIGDANLDGEFNSGDLVDVFQAGKFEADVEAGWHEGDWTGDHRFNSSDFVVAFQDGGFEQGPVVAANTVPEPTSLTLLFVTLFAMSVRSSRNETGTSFCIVHLRRLQDANP